MHYTPKVKCNPKVIVSPIAELPSETYGTLGESQKNQN